jgi:transposase-like protein
MSASRKGRPYIGKGKGPANKRAVLGLIERSGSVRTFHIASATKENVAKIVSDNIDDGSMLFTDESRLYLEVGATFLDHMTVKHSADEYVRGGVHTNTIESYFSVFKRGMRGVYQHCAEKHLQAYLNEFNFRHNHRVALGVNDVARAGSILAGVVGKRLTYETTSTR